MNETEYNILDFEFAWTTGRMDGILNAWDGILEDVIDFMIIDMFYPIFYSSLISCWLLLLHKKEETPRLGLFSFYASFIAAFCDYVENICSFVVLFNPNEYPSTMVLLISIFATIKFLLLVLAIIINLFFMISKLIKRN